MSFVLEVKDQLGATDRATVIVTVGETTPTINKLASPFLISYGTSARYTFSATDRSLGESKFLKWSSSSPDNVVVMIPTDPGAEVVVTTTLKRDIRFLLEVKDQLGATDRATVIVTV